MNAAAEKEKLYTEYRDKVISTYTAQPVFEWEGE